MGRLASVLGPVVGSAAAAAVALTGCGGGHKHTPATSTTTSTSSVPASSTSGSPTSVTTSSTAAPTTTSGPGTVTTAGSGPVITAFTVSPAMPVCNTPTMIQLQWTATNATSVDLSIDGKLFATYGGGAQSHLEYFACDRSPHTYLLTAHSATKSATASKVVTSTTNAG